MRKLLIGMIILLLLVPSVVSVSINKTSQSKNGRTLYVGGNGPGNYTSIQDAIDDAVNGDTVFVYNDSSPYHEELIVDKSIKLIGEDKKSTVIEIFESSAIIQVTGSGVIISDFTIRSRRGWLKENFGIELYGYVGGNTIENNCIENVEFGILISVTYYNNIRNNEITNGRYGILLSGSSYNNIYQNNITNNNNGIWADLGGMCHSCDNNNIYLNNIINNNEGISITCTRYSSQPRNNNISQNNIMYNRRGIYIDSKSYDNNIYHNNFINNIRNAKDKNCNGNYWDDGTEGNYWDNYRGKDKDGNGIGDRPYWIPPYIIGNKDRYPLMEPYDDVPDVSIKSVNKLINNRASSYSLYYWFLERFPLLAKLLSLLR